MANKNSTLDNTEQSNNQVLISYELLCLLRWLITHDSSPLKQIIANALPDLKRELYPIESDREIPTLEETQQIIVEFFGMLELLLLDAISEQAMKHAYERDLMPLIRHIDAQSFDTTTIQSSVAKVTHTTDEQPTAHMQSLLLKELLKSWKPHKKEVN